MSYEVTIIAENITDNVSDSSFSYTSKTPGAGYHQKDLPAHSVTYSVINFTGVIKMQGTLEINPADDDWFDITNTDIAGDRGIFGSQILNPDDSTSVENETVAFTGNFVWLRAAYNIQQGLISQIRYNH